MPFARRLSLVALLVLSTCSQDQPAATSGSGEKRKVIARTVLTSRLRSDFQYLPVHSGEPRPIQIHLTDLSNGSPVTAAVVRVTIRRRGAGKAVMQAVAEAGNEPGTYIAELIVAPAGDYDIEFQVRNATLDEQFPLSDLEVE